MAFARSAQRPERIFAAEAVVSAIPSIQPRAFAGAPGSVARNAGRSGTIISEETSVRKETQPSRTTVGGSRFDARESGRMSLFSTRAFILKLDPLSEKDLAASFLTEQGGVVRAAVRGARGKSRRSASLQLLSEVAVTLYRKEGAELARLDALELVTSAFDLASREETAMLLPYLAESALTFVPEAEPGGEVYRLVRHVLDALREGVPRALASRYFETWLLRFAGLLPEDGVCAACGEALPGGGVRLDPEIPGFVSPECAGRGAISVPASARALLAAFRKGSLKSLAARPPDSAALATLDEVAREVRRRFLGHELKSYRFLGALG